MTRPVRARINLQALTHNLSRARRAAPDSRIMAVIKANAYGHGAVPVARALSAADAFAVASLEEAMQLREAGIRHEIILLEGLFERDELELALTHQLQLVVHCEQQVVWLEQFRSGASLQLWLKVDTGMHRLGFAPDVALSVWQRLQRLGYVKTGGLRWLSHLACADEPGHALNAKQLARFNEILQFSESLQGVRAECSLANSAAVLAHPDMHFDWVRPGIMLYGASPLPAAADSDLRPAMTLESALISVQQRHKGDSIGYGQDWTCPRDMTLGVVAVGYADGYPRHAPNGTPVLVNGQSASLVGRVSMDMICVDLSDQPQAKPGDPVLLWGEGLPVETIAAQAGTISYELLCGVSARVPRSYAS